MIELMRKSERAAEERLDMVLTELQRWYHLVIHPTTSSLIFSFSFPSLPSLPSLPSPPSSRSKEYADSLQSRVTGITLNAFIIIAFILIVFIIDYELLILSDQSILNELYLTFSKDVLEKEVRTSHGLEKETRSSNELEKETRSSNGEEKEAPNTSDQSDLAQPHAEDVHVVKDDKQTNEKIEAAAAKEVRQGKRKRRRRQRRREQEGDINFSFSLLSIFLFLDATKTDADGEESRDPRT